MPKPVRKLVDAEDVLCRLSGIRQELAGRLGDGGGHVMMPLKNAFAARTPSELLDRARVLKRLIGTFHPLSPAHQARFRGEQLQVFESMLASMQANMTEFTSCVNSWIFEASNTRPHAWTEPLLTLNAMLPKTSATCGTDRDALESLENYMMRNSDRPDREVLFCEIDLRLTRLAHAGYLNAMTVPFYVAFLFIESGYPRIALPARALADAAILRPERYAPLLMAYSRHALHSLTTALAVLLLDTDEWPSAAGFYSDPELDLALATVREGLLSDAIPHSL